VKRSNSKPKYIFDVFEAFIRVVIYSLGPEAVQYPLSKKELK
jgi:hypothetical protein